MTNGSKMLLTGVCAAAIVAFAAWAVDIDVTGDLELPTVTADADVQSGELPNVEVTGDFEMPSVDADVDMQEGEMPRVDVRTVDVDMEMEETEVSYPELEVKEETATIEYPTFDVEKPEEDQYAENDDLNDQNTTTR